MNQKKIAGEKAAEFIKDGMIVGLGTGSTAKYLVDKVGDMVKNGLKIYAVATSKATEIQARELGIPLLDISLFGKVFLLYINSFLYVFHHFYSFFHNGEFVLH